MNLSVPCFVVPLPYAFDKQSFFAELVSNDILCTPSTYFKTFININTSEPSIIRPVSNFYIYILQLWVGPGSKAAEEKHFFDSHLAPFYRIEEVFVLFLFVPPLTSCILFSWLILSFLCAIFLINHPFLFFSTNLHVSLVSGWYLVKWNKLIFF